MTRLPFAHLADLDDQVIATYLEALEEQAKETKKNGRRRGRR